MKKLFCLMIAALALLTFACAEGTDAREILNPEGYSLIDVCDFWYEEGTDAPIVQGSFGDYIAETDVYEGFAMDDAYPLVVAADAVIALPDKDGNVVPATIEELDAFVAALRDANEPVSFFCSIELNEKGEVTKLIYCIPSEPTGEAPVLSPAFYNPNGYSLLRVDDAYQCDDEDYVVLGTFGEYDYSDELEPVSEGFEEPAMLIVLAPDAVLEMAADLETADNVPMTVEQFMDLEKEVQAKYDGFCSFYCNFEMNEEGVLTKLVFTYLPY